MKKSGFDKAIKKLLEKGKTYVGSSAGTILACPTIEVALWKGMDDPSTVKLNSFEGLGLVDFYVFVHYLNKWKGLVKEQKNKLNRRLICLTDKQAVTEEGLII